MLVILIVLMFLFEVLFNILLKYFRYNFKRDYLLIFLNLLYSTIWILYILRIDLGGKNLILYLIGAAQGIFSIIEIIYVNRKYKEQESVKYSLIRNKCRIVAFHWLEELNDEQIEAVIKISNSIEGKNKKNILVIAKDKEDKFNLLIFIYKENDCYSIKDKLNEYGNIDFVKENNRKQVILCKLV